MAGVGVTRVSDCSICLGTFKDPRVLPCGHTFCLICIKEYGRSKDSEPDPDCPICRAKFQVPSDGFEGLPKNYSLNSMLGENAVGVSKPKVTKRLCKKHHGEELVLYCAQCSLVICLDCMEEDHPKHNCCKISRFEKEARTQLESYAKGIHPLLSQVTKQRAQVHEESKKFCDLLDETELAINKEYENNKRFLDDHRRLLLEELCGEKHKVTKELKIKTDEIEAEHLRLASFNTRIEELLQGSDEATTFDMITKYKDFRHVFDELKQMQVQAIRQYITRDIKFLPGDLTDFISRRENAVGRLQMASDSRPKIESDKKLASKTTMEEIQEHTSNTCVAEKPEEINQDPFEGEFSMTIQSSDQHQLHEQISAMDHDGIKVILNDNKSFRIVGDFTNVEKAYEQWMALRNKKFASKTEESKEQTSDNCDAAKRRERKRVLTKNLPPTVKQVDVSLSQKVPIDQHVWYYLERKHPNKVNEVATQHLCFSRFVCEPSNEGITCSLEVVPYYKEDSEEAKKHVDDAVEEFAQLYQRVSEPGIVKESIELPVVLNQGMPRQLIAELEEAGVFFLRSDDPCLVGPKAFMEEAKQKVSDFIRRHNNSPAETQLDDNIGQAESLAADRLQPMNFKTPHGLIVHVSKGDLVLQSVDAIVNPANENLGHGGGAARVIAKAAGYVLERESNDFIWQHGKLGITKAMHTSAGNLRPNIQYVIHTVGPRKSDIKDDRELFGLVELAIFNCLCYANDKLKIHSIAIPAISSGIFGVSIEIVGRASFEALKMFDGYYASSKVKNLREIHFTNKDAPTFENMKRIFQFLLKDYQESSVDPEDLGNVMGCFEDYAAICGRQIIEITPHDNCFTRAFATVLERDFHSKFDCRKVEDMIKKELDNNKDYYKMFHASEESDKQWSFADVVKNPKGAFDAVANYLSPGDKGVDPDVWITAAANALNVQIVLVQLSEKLVPMERNVKPRSNKDDRTVYIAYHYCGHHHFDALVKKSGSEDTVSVKEVLNSVEETPAGTNNNLSASGHSPNGLTHTSNIDGSFEELNEDELHDMPLEMASGVAEKKAAKEKASDVAGKEAANKGDDAKRDDNDNHCIICMDEITDKKELPCKHKFCRECIDQYFSKGQPKCPSCGKVFGTLRGDQPKGTMKTQENNWQHLPGYHDCGTIEINYSFNDGRQGDNHPNPGQPYRGTHRTAYLPANREGREVLRLLKRAFDAGLVFTIGQSNTTGQNNVVIWNDVHHKTSVGGQYGYPDATYLKRVKEELAAKGIQ